MSHLIPIDEVVHFDICTHVASTGAVSDADSAPTFSVYEEDTDTAILGPTSMTKRTSLTGNYRGNFTASAANGFEAGKWYSVIVSATVSTVAAKTVGMHFRVAPAESSAGVPKGDVSHFGGTAGTFSGGRPEVNTTHIAGTAWASTTLFTLASHDPGATIGTSTLTQAQVTGGAYALNSASFAFNAALDLTTTQKASVNTEADAALSDVGLTSTITGRIDVATSTRLASASYTAPLDAAGTRSAVGLASANLDTQLTAIDDYLDTEVAAIKAKTDNLPSDPADASDIAASFSTVNSTLSTIAGYIDTEVAAILAAVDTEVGAIKTVTDKLNDTVEITSDGYIFTVAALQQAPSGTGASATDIADEVQTRTIAAVTVVNGFANNTITAAALASDAGTELATAVWASGTRTLTAIDEDSTTLDFDATIRAAVGMASANLDTQLGDIPTATENADALLNRDMSAVTDSNARSPLNALRFIRNKWSISGTTLTVTKEDDSTSAWTATVTASPGADPISGNDPT